MLSFSSSAPSVIFSALFADQAKRSSRYVCAHVSSLTNEIIRNEKGFEKMKKVCGSTIDICRSQSDSKFSSLRTFGKIYGLSSKRVRIRFGEILFLVLRIQADVYISVFG